MASGSLRLLISAANVGLTPSTRPGESVSYDLGKFVFFAHP